MNDDDRWSRLREIFDAARELPAAERAAFLDRELKDEPTVRADVEQLLKAESGAEDFLAPSPADLPVPERIGPYVLGERLGEGGFGIVFRAEQSQPLRRSVALKLIKPGMDTKEVIARFETERQALALMDHPAIARVFDAGETEAGRPYFAMELVDGVAITRFCDEGKLSIRERIELFLEVCDAVHHAHQKGVIHRDLKPSNVLVARRDGVPAPKVIDFGIAKATSVGLGPHSFATRLGAVLGTLGSMSPEQAGAIEAAVDIRSDIYSLGVMLYELLAGVPPFDGKRLRSMTWPDAIRVIREEDPPRLGALSRALRGDLEWITQRALEKEPARRYASVSEFAADLRRHLANETVFAGAPSRLYRFRKYVRRHRVGVAAAVFVLGAILAGGIVAAVGFERAVRAEREARREAEISRRVSEFLESLFESARPDKSGGDGPVTAKAMLDEGARLIEEQLKEDPEIRARLLTTMGRSYLFLGEFDAGLQLLENALAVAESYPSPDPKLVLYQLHALANGRLSAGSNKGVSELLDRANALASSTQKGEVDWLVRSLQDQANLLFLAGDFATADSVVAKAIGAAESSTETGSGIRVRLHELRGLIAFGQFDLDRAEGAFRRALELNAGESREPREDATCLTLLSNVFASRGSPDSALNYAESAIDVSRRELPEDRLTRATAVAAKAHALADLGEAQEAASLFEEAIETHRSSRGNRHVLANELNGLAIHYLSMGRFEDAVDRASEAVQVSRAEYGEESTVTGQSLAFLALVLHQSGRAKAADSCYSGATKILERTSPSGIDFAQALMNHGTLCRDERRLDRASELYRRAEAAFDSTTSGSRELLGMCLTNHGYTKSLQGKHDEAESLMTRGMALRQGKRTETSPELGPGFVAWGAARELAGDRAGSLEKLRLAAACGATLDVAQEYPELLAMRSSRGFPLAKSP